MTLKYKQVIASVVTVLTIVSLLIAIWEFTVKKVKKNYAGEWSMTSEIEEAQLRNYTGMKIQWILRLSQFDDKITGVAEKIAVNEMKLSFKERTTLNLDGSVDGNKFILTFIEKGKRRETSGTFNGEFLEDRFTGIFSSSASETKGKITGFRTR